MNQPPNFNRLAGLYRWMEFFSFGPWLALTRRTFLCKFAHCQRALVLGDGDGRFSARLLRTNAAIRLDAADGSQAMLASLLRRASSNAARVRTHQADIRDWQPPAESPCQQAFGPPYDLIATHFFLDCLESADVRLLAAKIRQAASPRGLWVISEFAIPCNRFGRWIARPLVSSLYLSFGLLTGLPIRHLPDFESALRDAGFSLVERRSRLGGLLVAQLWETTESKPPLIPQGDPSNCIHPLRAKM